MATEVARPGPAAFHSCFKELNPTSTSGDRLDRLVAKKEQPLGLISRCSCGTLWILQHFHGDYNEWVVAGWKLRLKHRKDGWEGVNNEGY